MPAKARIDDSSRMESSRQEAAGPPPVVLTVAGSDPSAGAGLQADLLTLASLGAHGCTAVTALTVQDSVNVRAYRLVNPEDTVAQARAVLEDMAVQVIKIGMLGSVAMIAAVSALLADYPQIPVVLDPVLAAGGGTALAGAGLCAALVAHLLPQVTVMTPNGPEALALSGADDLPTAGARLNRQGAKWVLISGGHGEGPELENMLFRGIRAGGGSGAWFSHGRGRGAGTGFYPCLPGPCLPAGEGTVFSRPVLLGARVSGGIGWPGRTPLFPGCMRSPKRA